jgi:hypothetical protein
MATGSKIPNVRGMSWYDVPSFTNRSPRLLTMIDPGMLRPVENCSAGRPS